MTTADGDTELVQLQQHVPFTMVENSIIQSLGDYVALGLYLDMRSRPPGWRINLANLSKTKKQGRESLTGAMNTLIENGLVFRVKFQRPTGRWATRIYVAQRPVTLDELLAVRDSYSGRCTIVTSTALTDSANPRKPAAAPDTATGIQPPGRRVTSEVDHTAEHLNDPLTEASVEPTARSAVDEAVNSLVTPTDGKPTLGEPELGWPTVGEPMVGQPETGEPTIGNPALKYQEERANTPPPTPSTAESRTTREGEEEHPAGMPDDPHPDSEPTGRHNLARSAIEAQPAAGGAADASAASAPILEVDNDRIRVDQVLEAVVQAWPQLGSRDLAKLAAPIGSGLTVGLSVDELVEHLTRNTSGVRHPASVLLARCDNLPRPRRQLKAIPEWCGDCEGPNHRWIEIGPDHRPVRCARCNPQAIHH